MDAGAFRDRVTEEMATELDRLGSEKLLLALTDADLTTTAVHRAAAASEAAARETFEEWAATAGDDAAAETFDALAAQEAEHYDRVREASPSDGDPGTFTIEEGGAGPLHAHLRGLDGTLERAAGLVGRGLVSDRTHLQVISFFVNEGDTGRADLFRDLRAETETATQEGLDLLAARCEADEDWEAAAGVATYAIQLAYDDYADALAGMGMDPKPIC